MSDASDYIKLKRLTSRLKYTRLPPVLTSRDYAEFSGYTTAKDVVNTNPVMNQLTPSGNQVLFGMEKNTTYCPTYALCNVNARTNRVLLKGESIDPRPYRPVWVKRGVVKDGKPCC